MKKAFKIIFISLAALFLILLLIPLLFRDKIFAIVKREINEAVHARVEFSDLDISLIRRFPRVSVSVQDLSIVGLDRFEGDTLLSSRSIDIALNLMSVIRGDQMEVHTIQVRQPRMYAIVTADGQANWDILQSAADTAEAADSSTFRLALQSYAIHDGTIRYSDSAGNMYAVVTGLDHSGSGDFTAEQFRLSTQTSAAAVDFSYGGIPYLSSVKASIRADLDVDLPQSTYRFRTEDILLNSLQLASDGYFRMLPDDAYEMDIRFNAPSTDLRHILSLIPVIYQKDFDQVKTSGNVLFNGWVKGIYTEERIPAFALKLKVENGSFQYPDLPAPVRDIQIALDVENPDGVTDHTVINLSRGHFVVEQDPFDIRLLVRTPESNMWVDAGANGLLNLDNIPRIVKLDPGTTLKGTLQAALAVKGHVEQMQKQQLDQFQASGDLRLQQFAYASPEFPEGVAIDNLHLNFNPRQVALREARGKYRSSNFQASGQLENLIAYVLKDRTLQGSLQLQADRVNVREFMTTEESADSDTASGVFVVPANLDLTLKAEAGELQYDNLLIQQLRGTVKLADETLDLQRVEGKALGGTIAISGSYSTRENKKVPRIALRYDVEGLDVRKTFETFVTVQKLMPIGKFLGGKLSSELTMTGTLGEDMFPNLASLAGAGKVLLAEGFLRNFKPVDLMADRLQINELKDLSLREIREQFEFTNGQVLVKPFTVRVGDISMEIGGVHGFDQRMDYTVNLQLPRKMLGNRGNEVLQSLITQAASRGVELKNPETVNLQVKMLGSIDQPDIRFDLKETATGLATQLKEQAEAFVKAKVDSASQAVRDTLTSLKNQAVREAADQLKKQIFGSQDTASANDSSRQKPADAAEKLKESGKEALEKLNPFRKKN